MPEISRDLSQSACPTGTRGSAQDMWYMSSCNWVGALNLLCKSKCMFLTFEWVSHYGDYSAKDSFFRRPCPITHPLCALCALYIIAPLWGLPSPSADGKELFLGHNPHYPIGASILDLPLTPPPKSKSWIRPCVRRLVGCTLEADWVIWCDCQVTYTASTMIY